MPRRTKEIAQLSPDAEQVTASLVTRRGEEQLSELDAQILERNSNTRLIREELTAIADARRTRAEHLVSLTREVERLEAAHNQAVSYARLTGGPATNDETGSKLATAQQVLAEAQVEQSLLEEQAGNREATLEQIVSDQQSQVKALARQSESVEQAMSKAIGECGQRRLSEAKQAILDCKAQVKSAASTLKVKQKQLASLLSDTESEFRQYGWLDYWDTIAEALDAQELAEEAAAIESEDEDE